MRSERERERGKNAKQKAGIAELECFSILEISQGRHGAKSSATDHALLHPTRPPSPLFFSLKGTSTLSRPRPDSPAEPLHDSESSTRTFEARDLRGGALHEGTFRSAYPIWCSWLAWLRSGRRWRGRGAHHSAQGGLVSAASLWLFSPSSSPSSRGGWNVKRVGGRAPDRRCHISLQAASGVS